MYQSLLIITSHVQLRRLAISTTIRGGMPSTHLADFTVEHKSPFCTLSLAYGICSDQLYVRIHNNGFSTTVLGRMAAW